MQVAPESRPPVFYDPEQRRWRRFKRISQLIAALLTIVFGVMIASVLVNPSLPQLQLSPMGRLLAPPPPATATLVGPVLPGFSSNAEPGASRRTRTATRTPPPPSATATLYFSPTPPPATDTETPTSPPRPSNPPATPEVPVPTIPVETPTPPGQGIQHTPTAPAPTPPILPATTTPNAPPTGVPPTQAPPTPTHGANPTARPSVTQHPHPTPPITPPGRKGPAGPSYSLNIPINLPVSDPAATAGYQTPLIGFYVSWSEASFVSLQEHLNQLDAVIADWVSVAQGDGSLFFVDPVKQARLLAYVREHRPDMAILPLVNNYNYSRGVWDSQGVAKMLDDPAARARTIEGLRELVDSNHFSGVNIDLEEVPAGSQPALIAFMSELYATFHPLGLTVTQSLPFDNSIYDYHTLAQYSDYLILMTYDQHWSGPTGGAGPLASQTWFAAALARRFAEVRSDHLALALGSYGYDWPDGRTDGDTLSFQEIMQLARDSHSPVRFDASFLNPTLDYADETGTVHHVWFLDAVTVFNQLMQARAYHPRALALWRLGAEDPSVWTVFDRRDQLDGAVARSLQTLPYGYDLDWHGQGEILRVAGMPHQGARNLTLVEPSGLITSEQFTAYPANYAIDRWGGADKRKIALTFDDGPDPNFTPRILDILKRYAAPATFFVIGMNADLHSDLLRREWNEGDEIGNHTFTHPDLTAISDEQLKFELNATERVFESRLGRRSLLFRPPYGEDVEPATPDQVKPLVTTSALGYLTIGMQIDPGDWRSPGVDKIVEETLTQAKSGGNIVLLHDGGGDREQTVAALPHIIEGLRAEGFQLVLVSDLQQLPRDRVMPAISPREQIAAIVYGVGFKLLSQANAVMGLLFAVGILLGVLRLVLVALLAVTSRKKKRAGRRDYLPRVGVIVPAYNEEKVVCNTVRSLLRSTYPRLDVLVVDDGSLDQTYARLVEAFADDPYVHLFTKPNGGKADALNFGMRHSDAEILVTIDADTVVLPDAISKLVPHFMDPRVSAVAGNTKVGNRINLLTDWQALEYITSQNLDRRAFAALNSITVVPGALGAWRREAVLQAGGFTNDTLAEDAALTMALLRLGHKVEYEPAAIALTEAPDTIGGLIKQRFRWMYGTLQAAWKNLDTLFRPRYRALGLVALPNILIFQVFFPLISPLMDLMLFTSIASIWFERYQHPLSYSTASLLAILYYYALFLAIDYAAALIAFLLEPREDKGLLAWLFLQRLVYRQLMYYVAVRSALTALRGPAVGWGKLERKATVPSG